MTISHHLKRFLSYTFNSACWVIFHDFLSSRFFSKSSFLKNSFRDIIWVSNSLDPDQAQQGVGPDLGPNCLQTLSVELTSKELKADNFCR